VVEVVDRSAPVTEGHSIELRGLRRRRPRSG
jgi:hypothetical protein